MYNSCTSLSFYFFLTFNAIEFSVVQSISNGILLTYRDSGNRKGRQKDYQPTMWNEHFDEMQDVIVDNERTFRVYFAKRDAENKKPLLVLLHGGGYSALTWAHFTVFN